LEDQFESTKTMGQYKNYNHEVPIQVRFGDIDSMNHVNNAKYLTYIESARIAYVKEVLSADVDFSRYSIILAKACIDFLVPIGLNDDIKVFTRCSRIGNRSFDLDCELVKVNNDQFETVAKGHTVMVAFDYEQNTTIQIMEEWRKRISDFEGEQYD